jgi:class 3 adenylate cyclase
LAQIERRLAAIMLADIAGYSTLMERAEARTFERVRTMREELINPIVGRFGGRIIKTTGDGFLAEFSSGTAALLCGIDLQRLNHAREAKNAQGERLHLRIGINLGDIIFDGDDVSGDGVNVAARLEPLAPEDGICISGAVRDQIREDLDVVYEDLGEQYVKNIARPIRAYRINLANAPDAKGVVLIPNSSKRLIAAIASVFILSLGGLYWYQKTPNTPQPSVQIANGSPKRDFAGIKITSALVIGNSKYLNHPVLENAGNDAIAIATSLKLRGVPVNLKLDLSEDSLIKEIEYFKKQNDGGSVQFLYYAGHGWNLGGKNFIFPIDAPANNELLAGKVLEKIYPVENMYRNIAGKMILLLDTHGDPVSVPDNVVLTFSGSPKNLALDSYRLPDGTLSRNSPYAASIVEMLSGADENLPTAFLKLAQRVGKKTNGMQIPWVSGSIVGASSWGVDQAKH